MRHRTVVGMPQQNGVAERMNKMLLEKARCMLSHSGLGKEFWAKVINSACYLVNRSPHSFIECKTPEEVWSGKLADYSTLRVFGCPAYAHVKEDKLDPRAKKCIFLGYGEGVKGYRLWCADPKSSKFLISRDLTFDESAMLRVKEHEPVKEEEQVKKKMEFEIPVSNVQPHSVHSIHADIPQVESESDASDEEEQQDYSLVRNRERKAVRAPTRYGFSDFAYCLAVAEEVEFGEPSNYKEAVASSDVAKWKAAMKEEIESLYKNQTWKLVEQPKGKKIVHCKWVFKKKDDTANVRYKARLVAKGYSQVEGVDFNEVFSPVVKHTYIRVFLSVVVAKNYELEQLDVKTTFLHGDLEEHIYMQQLEGYAIYGKENHVCLLKKSLYDLKQSPR